MLSSIVLIKGILSHTDKEALKSKIGHISGKHSRKTNVWWCFLIFGKLKKKPELVKDKRNTIMGQAITPKVVGSVKCQKWASVNVTKELNPHSI